MQRIEGLGSRSFLLVISIEARGRRTQAAGARDIKRKAAGRRPQGHVVLKYRTRSVDLLLDRMGKTYIIGDTKGGGYPLP